MACTYTYNGNNYTEAEIKNLISTGSISEIISNLAYVDIPNSQSVGANSPLKGIIEDSKNWTKESEDSQTMQYNGGLGDAARVTARVLGIMNKMRFNPTTSDADTYALQDAKNRWGKVDPNVALDTPLGFMNMQQYADKKQEEYDYISTRGTLLHLYFKMYAQTSDKEREAVAQQISDYKDKHEIPPYTYNWLSKLDDKDKPMIERIYSKWGINTFDDGVRDQDRDKIYPEVTVGNFEDLIIDGLGVVGTPDLMVEHSNGEVSLYDIKTGQRFNSTHSHELFKYGSQPNVAIYNNHRERAKLQLTWYAILMKLKNPDLKFRNIAVGWIPNAKSALAYDHRASVELADYLGMIEAYLRNEHKEAYQKLISKYGKKLFQAKNYMPAYEQTIEQELKDRSLNSELEIKLDQLRELVLYDIKEFSTSREEESMKLSNKRQAAKLFDEIVDLINDFKITKDQLSQIPDMSWLSMWLGSNKDIASVWVQYYDKMLNNAKNAANEKTQEELDKFDALAKPVYADNARFFKKSPFEGIPFLRTWFNLLSSSDQWSWIYTDVKDDKGNVVGRRLRYTDKDFADLASDPKFAGLGAMEARKNLARYIVDVYDSKFIGKNAVANKKATVRKDQDGVYQEVTNLDLANEARRARENVDFTYSKGWFPKVPKLLEEFGTILNANYRREVWNRSVKSHIEDQFEQVFNNVEAIPLKYLGSDFINTSGNYSLNAEFQFKKFVAHSNMKEQLDDVYAFGKALQFYLQYHPEKGVDKERGRLFYKNTIDYLETAIEMQVRGRKQMEFPGGIIKREDFLPRAGDQGKVYKIDWVKVFHTLMSVASAPIMWLKAGPGIANGLFIYLYTLKEAVKNDIIKSRGAVKYLGVEGDEFSFGVKEVAWATKEYFKMQLDAMRGRLLHNKLYLMAKKLRYLPDAYDWGASADSMLSTRLRFMSKSTMYMFHRVPEEFVALVTMGAQLKGMKLSSGGSLWDAYQLKAKAVGTEQYSTLEWNEQISRGKVRAVDGSLSDLKELDTNEIRRMHYVYQRLNGGYRPDERTRMEYYVLGEMFMQFKKYLPNILRSGFASRHQNYAWGRYKLEEGANSEQIKEWHASVMEGRWKVLGGLALNVMSVGKLASKSQSLERIRNKWLGLKPNESYNWSELSPDQKEIVVDAAVTFGFMALLLTGRHFMFGGGGDSDDSYVKALYNRLITNFSQQWNIFAVMEDILSPNVVPASWRWSYQFLDAASTTFLSSALLLTGQEEISGFRPLTRSGDLRGWNQLQRTVPILSSYRDFYRLIEDAGLVEEPLNPAGRR